MLKAIIIEDETRSRELLNDLVSNFCEGVEIIGTAVNVVSGIDLIRKLKPGLVFLDIEMPGGDGFEVLKAFHPIPFKVIFVTGYEQYAIQAIRYSALDYLLKPINILELQTAVKKAVRQPTIHETNVQSLEWNLQSLGQEAARLAISNDKEHVLVALDKILYIAAEGSYVHFMLEGTRRQLASHSLSHYEELLPANQFYRTHNSYIVNCNKVVSVSSGRGGEVLLQGGATVPIAFRRKSAFIKLLGIKQ